MNMYTFHEASECLNFTLIRGETRTGATRSAMLRSEGITMLPDLKWKPDTTRLPDLK